MKRIVGISIVLFWFVMVGLLIRRTLPGSSPLPTTATPVDVAAPQTRTEEWMGIYHQDQKVGYIQRRLTPIDTGYQWEEQGRMKLRVLNTPQLVHTDVRARTDRRYALTDFSFRMLSSGVVFQVTGEVGTHAGPSNGADTQELRGQITTGGETSSFSFPLREPIYLPATTQMALRHTTLQPGEERRFSIFNPLSMRPDTVSITTIGPETLLLNGKTLTATKIAEHFAGTTVHAWLDQDGKVVKEEAPLGLVLIRESQEDALGGGWQDNTPLDLVASVAIPVQQPLLNPRVLSQLRLKLSGLSDHTSFTFPPRQQQQDRIITITQEKPSTLETYSLPQTNSEFAPDLASTPFLQSTHPRLLAQAQQILGPERDALKAAHRLLDWTYTALEKVPTVSMPTALEVLQSQKGDCNEHAVLFTALARAGGLPARVAAGVVYLDGAFYYHAWSEVWLGQWVAVDPALGQFPADATHVKFLTGGPEEHLALLKVIGQLKMEVVDYQ